MNNLSEWQAAYLAGIIDGEGSVMLTNRRPSPTTFRKPAVSVASCDWELIEALKTLTGIGQFARKPPQKETHRESYSWAVRYNDALDFLEPVYPYMVIVKKRRRAEMLVRDYRRLTAANGRYTAEGRAAKLAFEEAFFAL